jgi:hypothetical protein
MVLGVPEWYASLLLCFYSKLMSNRPPLLLGNDCMYRHALPPGFVLKSQKKAMEEAAKANEISLEEFLEVEVCALLLISWRTTLNRDCSQSET